MHRVEGIVNAALTAIKLGDFNGQVFKHRVLELSEEADELPAVSVHYGADSPPDDDGVQNFNVTDSIVEIDTVIYLKAETETELLQSFLDARVAVHKAMLSGDQTLSLAYVQGVRYAGASPPETGANAEYVVGALVCHWLVAYRSATNDPSV